MTAIETFTFSGYTLRPATKHDLSLAQLWTLADVHHAEITAPSFWVEQRLGRDAFILSDGAGPVFFFKMHQLDSNEVELHIQFMPDTCEEDRARMREGLVQGMTWLERVLRLSGVSRVSFDSRNPELVSFSRKRLGFDVSGHRLTKAL